MSSIKSKLTVNVLIICLVGMITVAISNYLIARKVIVEESLDKTNQLAIQQGEEINSWFKEQGLFLKTVGVDMTVINNKENLFDISTAQKDNNKNIYDFYFGFSDDSAIFSSGWIPTSDWLPTERSWYKDAVLANGELSYSEPYMDPDSKKLVITISQHIGNLGNLETVSAIDIYLDKVIDIVEKVETYEGGYVFLADQNEMIIAHPDKKFVPTEKSMTSMNDIENYKKVLELQKEDLDIKKIKDYDSITRYFITYKINSTGWTLYVAVPESAIIKSSNHMLMYVIPILLVVIVFAVILTRLIVNIIIIKPIYFISEAANKLANGNLNISVSTNSKDELGVLSNDFSKVVDTLNLVITDLSKMSNKHFEGDLDYIIDESRFTGAYKDVVSGINKINLMYTNNFLEVLGVVEKFGNGDFSAPLRSFLGKQAIGNQIIERLRTNLKKVNSEIDILAEAALEGNLLAKANTNELKGDWNKILNNLNNVMKAIVIPIKEASDVLIELSKGNLKVKMEGNYKGDFALIKTTMNSTIVELESYIDEISSTLSSVSQNDLSKEITRDYLGNFTEIKTSINLIIGTLNTIINEISITTKLVNEGIQKVSISNEILSEGSMKQASETQQLTAFIANINENTLMNAKNSEDVNKLSLMSMENALKGNNEMGKMLIAMNEIKNASNSIGKIMTVIEDISFQTNILSLNASVEAARAGSKGKGFGVVATEVGTLASRSQEASKETSILVSNAIVKISDGTQIANITSDALIKIVDNVTEVSKIISNIYIDSKEQSDSLSQATKGIDQIAQIAQENSIISVQNINSVKVVLAQANDLNNILKTFKLKDCNNKIVEQSPIQKNLIK